MPTTRLILVSRKSPGRPLMSKLIKSIIFSQKILTLSPSQLMLSNIWKKSKSKMIQHFSTRSKKKPSTRKSKNLLRESKSRPTSKLRFILKWSLLLRSLLKLSMKSNNIKNKSTLSPKKLQLSRVKFNKVKSK